MKKVALFAYRGEGMCFVHVLLNAMDLRSKGYDLAVVIEGTATKTIAELDEPSAEFHDLYVRVRDSGLIDCVCRACSHKMGVVEEVERQGLSWGTEMSGHPAISRYLDEGYEVLTF